eukprot:CAMPEP_0194705176 /NCGR_PEP_ID=MMETSP0295-20121207/28771_1 /TAXON_ID=39354 /ORGANISM="Heterosigma akashiwo, Strain CCMP2393" /LENGTH=367 /DNA_ID=CAMNT_0039600799 /DNA_START=20 /DNA_END=1122 /DNA_ORIENTATION=+
MNPTTRGPNPPTNAQQQRKRRNTGEGQSSGLGSAVDAMPIPAGRGAQFIQKAREEVRSQSSQDHSRENFKQAEKSPQSSPTSKKAPRPSPWPQRCPPSSRVHEPPHAVHATAPPSTRPPAADDERGARGPKPVYLAPPPGYLPQHYHPHRPPPPEAFYPYPPPSYQQSHHMVHPEHLPWTQYYGASHQEYSATRHPNGSPPSSQSGNSEDFSEQEFEKSRVAVVQRGMQEDSSVMHADSTVYTESHTSSPKIGHLSPRSRTRIKGKKARAAVKIQCFLRKNQAKQKVKIKRREQEEDLILSYKLSVALTAIFVEKDFVPEIIIEVLADPAVETMGAPPAQEAAAQDTWESILGEVRSISMLNCNVYI